MYAGDKTAALLTAVRDFTENYPDPKAGIIVTSQLALYGSTNLWTVFYFYDGVKPPPHVFENFTKLASGTDTTGSKQYSDLLFENNAIAVINNTYLTVSFTPVQTENLEH
jgi:hypothetical protein